MFPPSKRSLSGRSATCANATLTNTWWSTVQWCGPRLSRTVRPRRISPAKTAARYTRPSRISTSSIGSYCRRSAEVKWKRSQTRFSSISPTWKRGEGSVRWRKGQTGSRQHRATHLASVIIDSLFPCMGLPSTRITRRLRYKRCTRHWSLEWFLVLRSLY